MPDHRRMPVFRAPKPEAFRAWLRDQAPAAIIGAAQCTADCPLVHFLDAYEVTENRAYAEPLDEGTPLPRWAVRFVRVLDTHYDFNADITAAQALACLDVASPETRDAEPPHGRKQA